MFRKARVALRKICWQESQCQNVIVQDLPLSEASIPPALQQWLAVLDRMPGDQALSAQCHKSRVASLSALFAGLGEWPALKRLLGWDHCLPTASTCNIAAGCQYGVHTFSDLSLACCTLCFLRLQISSPYLKKKAESRSYSKNGHVHPCLKKPKNDHPTLKSSSTWHL